MTHSEVALCARAILHAIETKYSTSIASQYTFLMGKDRYPISIFVSYMALKEAVGTYPENEVPELLRAYGDHGFMIGKLLGCPVYCIPKLTESPVMVVGEVSWKDSQEDQ